MRRWGALVAVVLFAACGNGTTLDGPKLEGQIRKQLRAVGVQPTAVKCPHSRRIHKGDVFSCEAKARTLRGTDATLGIRVVQVDKSAHVNWDVVSGLLDVAELKQNIKQGYAPTVTVEVDCHTTAKFLAGNDGDSFDCVVSNVTNSSDTAAVKVTFNSKASNQKGFEWAPVS